MNKAVAVLTYPVKHRKTYDTLSLLKANGYDDVKVYAIPFSYRKKVFPLIQHRPEMNFHIPETKELCHNLGYGYEEGDLDSFTIDEARTVLIAGAGILPEKFVENHIIINSHPGFIPNSRGLDTFKWAIAEMEPLGVTTHFVGVVDAGVIIDRKIINIYASDTFHSAAQRVYENEVSMLVEAIEKCDDINLATISGEGYGVHKRMSRDIEENLMEMFEQYKKKYATDFFNK